MNLFGKSPDDLCGICMKPIADGEAIYTIPDKNGRVRHHACYEKDNPFKQLRAALDKMQASLEGLRSPTGESLRDRLHTPTDDKPHRPTARKKR